MRVAVTGTPGTGKTTATELLESRLDAGVERFDGEFAVVHVGELLEAEELYTDVDDERGSKVADLEALVDRLDGLDDVVIESHLAHHVPVDRVAVLRCEPTTLETRLLERGEPDQKARENAESEALDVILAEAVERHGRESVYEIDTTDRDPTSVAANLEAVVAGEREPSAGEVDFVGYLE
ncbi:adenylate kinase family protein [Natrarchaeobius oligotrophus]|uniref:Putative adenylate kinase n=1 Tax=Natrarchaeobius chitinivorans TaxID=1679083 RepID=A0A3N6MHC0_NATCH|nr:adenylate kinase family protein [Natrarchaeobius chitinivorans]RQG96260.1 adenylate kinase [Natrarchaeobius chitinivorans]